MSIYFKNMSKYDLVPLNYKECKNNCFIYWKYCAKPNKYFGSESEKDEYKRCTFDYYECIDKCVRKFKKKNKYW